MQQMLVKTERLQRFHLFKLTCLSLSERNHVPMNMARALFISLIK